MRYLKVVLRHSGFSVFGLHETLNSPFVGVPNCEIQKQGTLQA